MSGSDELQNHMNKGMYGTPQLKPDEKRKYLGTFRERVDLTLTFEQIKDPEYLADLKQELTLHPELHVIINGQVENPLLSELMQLAQEANVTFTCNTDQTLHHGPKDLAVVVCDKNTALHVEEVDVAKRYPKTTKLEVAPEHKESPLERLHKLFE